MKSYLFKSIIIWQNKLAFLPNSVCINTIIQMDRINNSKAYRENAKRELSKNVISYIEQILEATPHETIAVRPLTSHL